MRISRPYTAAPYKRTASQEAKWPHCPVKSGTIRISARTISHRFGRMALFRNSCKDELYHETVNIANKATQDAPQR